MSMKIKQILFLFLFASMVWAPSQVIAQTNAGVADIVKEVFAGIPDMIKVAQCESGTRQFTADGTVVRNKSYVGVFQIDENIHAQVALKQGLDIYTAIGNIAYAKRLYDANGTNPWKGCLGGVVATSSVIGALTVNMNFGMVNPQVKTLQQMLNKLGYTVSKTGPGSAGQETTMFGSLTREAVKKFQCEKNIVCSGNESTTGYGRVGPMTRATLNRAIGN